MQLVYMQFATISLANLNTNFEVFVTRIRYLINAIFLINRSTLQIKDIVDGIQTLLKEANFFLWMIAKQHKMTIPTKRELQEIIERIIVLGVDKSSKSRRVVTRYALWQKMMDSIHRISLDAGCQTPRDHQVERGEYWPIAPEKQIANDWMVNFAGDNKLQFKRTKYKALHAQLTKFSINGKVGNSELQERKRKAFSLAKNQRVVGKCPKLLDKKATEFATYQKIHRYVEPLMYMTRESIEAHIASIQLEAKRKQLKRLSTLVIKLMEHTKNHKGIFNTPVDPVALNLPTYFKVIERPMDLGTVKSRLDTGYYSTIDEFASDVRLVFQNAMTFNPKNHGVHMDAKGLLEHFHTLFQLAVDKMASATRRNQEHACDVCIGHTCVLCRQKCLDFNLPTITCSGTCRLPIRRGVICYRMRDGTRAWCSKCYNKMNKTSTAWRSSDGSDATQNSFEPLKLRKEPKLHQVKDKLIKTRCSVEVEPWVKCDVCSQWMHQTCGLFNIVDDHMNAKANYSCPLCRLEQLKVDPNELQIEVASNKVAKGLPKCHMSNYMEEFLAVELRKNKSEDLMSTLALRVVTSTNRSQEIPTLVKKVFSQNSAFTQKSQSNDIYPAAVPYVSKGIYLFQKIDGVDVCLFGLYVQEYDHTSPLVTNKRTTYIAYLDSIQYLRPPATRTLVYHSILLGYLDYVRMRGFVRAHIWSCPPQRSVSYVFWCRPAHQKTPGVEHLREWYNKMLEKAKVGGIISGWNSFHDRYFKSSSKDAKQSRKVHVDEQLNVASNYCWPGRQIPPCFEGDYWPAEADRLVRKKLKASSSVKARVNSIDSAATSQSSEPKKDPIFLRDVYHTTSSSVESIKEDLLVIDLIKPTKMEELQQSTGGIKNGKLFDRKNWNEIVEPDTIMDHAKFVASRHSFHQLCAHSSFQFDSLRRAKHSSMMIMHHLVNSHLSYAHNFCDACGLLISESKYWHCKHCDNYSLCDWCSDQGASKLLNGAIEGRAVLFHQHPIVFRNRN